MAGKVVKLDIGTVYQKSVKGGYYFRYQVNGQRKAVSLKTKNQREAVAKAKDIVPIVQSTTPELVSAHITRARGFNKEKKPLQLRDVWELYQKHPDRAIPATVAERESYRASLESFIRIIDGDDLDISEVTSEHAAKFYENMLSRDISASTHNRTLRRLRRIFSVFADYLDNGNPLEAKSLYRKPREDQNTTARRISFTREQEQALLEVLDNDSFKVMHKPEIRVVYYLGMFTGQRMKDCVLLTWDRVNLERRRIWVKQFKTGKEVSIPMADKLRDVLLEAQSWQSNHYVCPNVAARYSKVDSRGKNVGNNLVNIDVLWVIKWIGLEPSVKVPGRAKKVTVYGFHSLRHSFISHCAEAGVPKAVVVSIIGANSNIIDKHYTHVGDEAQEKAIMDLTGDAHPATDRERIRKALAIINGLPDKSQKILEIEQALTT